MTIQKRLCVVVSMGAEGHCLWFPVCLTSEGAPRTNNKQS